MSFGSAKARRSKVRYAVVLLALKEPSRRDVTKSAPFFCRRASSASNSIDSFVGVNGFSSGFSFGSSEELKIAWSE